MAGGGGGRRRSAGESPGERRSSRRPVASCPRGGPPWTSPRPPRGRRDPPDIERPLTFRRSPRLRSQKENVPAGSPSPTLCAPPSPPSSSSPAPPPSPPPPPPRVRRSYSRLEPPRGLGGGPLSPIAPHNVPSPPRLPPPPPALPGIGGAPPERKRKKKVPPIDLLELEAWAARMNAQFEEAERFRLVVE